MSNSGIRFNDCFFTEPVALDAWTPPKCAGLFALLVSDPNWAPKNFQPVYFGEFGNNSPAPALLQECRRVVASAQGKRLFVAVFPMPFSTSQQRWTLRHELIEAYHPDFQGAHDLATKFADLEQRHQEQTAQFMQLMAAMNPALDAPPVRRRRIGFLPLAEPAVE